MTQNRLLYHLVSFGVVAVWGATFISTKVLLLSGLTAAQIFTLRFVIAYVMLLGYSFWQSRQADGGGQRLRLLAGSWRDELLMVLLGATGGSLYFLAENSAMNYTTTTNTSLIVSLSPLVAAVLISICYKSERLSRMQALGTLIAAIGVTIVVLNGHFVLHLSPLGDSLAFAAALCWGCYSLLMIPANHRYGTLFITRKVFFYGLLTVIPYYLWHPEETAIFLSPSTFQLTPSILFNLLFLGCIASMLCFVAWNWVLKKLGTMVATNYVYFNPVTTILFAWLILSERITLYFLVGTLLILAGMYLADRKR